MSAPSVPHSTYDAFRNAVNGNGYDMDGSYGYQCWDGVDLLYEQSDVGQYLYTAYNVGGGDPYAKTCWSNINARNRNGSGHFSMVYNASEIKKGDILVFNTYSGWYGTAGHIGFADEDYNGTEYINILSQNFGPGSNPTTGLPFNIRQAFLGSAFLGAFRYDKWATPTPPPPTPTAKKSKFPFPIAWNHWPNFKRF